MLDEQLNVILLQAAEIWSDKAFLKFIERYQPELYEAFLDFMVDTGYDTMSLFGQAIFWGLPWRNGKLHPEKMHDLGLSIECVEQGRGIWLG